MSETEEKNIKGNSRKVYIKTYGCQMNVYDSQRMGDSLDAEGYVATDTPDDADLILLNTCHIREKAAEKLYSDLGRLRVMRQERDPMRPLTIGVTGCVAQKVKKFCAAHQWSIWLLGLRHIIVCRNYCAKFIPVKRWLKRNMRLKTSLQIFQRITGVPFKNAVSVLS